MKWAYLLFGILLSGMPIANYALQGNADQQAPQEFTPTSVQDVLYLRPFTLDTGYPFTWVPDQPIVQSGVIVVLEVNPELVIPTNAAEPILYAGERVVHRLNNGHESGHVIAIIPGDFDPSVEPIWFGRPGLPLRATKGQAREELASAKGYMRPISAEKMEGVTQEPMRAPNLAELLRGELAELILEFSPQESDLARKWRLLEAVAPENEARPSTPPSPSVQEGNGGA